jgi:hypothetical protein
MLILGILAKRVKIGKNLSIRAFGCRNITCIRKSRVVIGQGGPRSQDRVNFLADRRSR